MKVQNKDGKGNPWHSDATGEFTSPGGDGSKNKIFSKASKWGNTKEDDLTEDDLWGDFFSSQSPIVENIQPQNNEVKPPKVDAPKVENNEENINFKEKCFEVGNALISKGVDLSELRCLNNDPELKYYVLNTVNDFYEKYNFPIGIKALEIGGKNTIASAGCLRFVGSKYSGYSVEASPNPTLQLNRNIWRFGLDVVINGNGLGVRGLKNLVNSGHLVKVEPPTPENLVKNTIIHEMGHLLLYRYISKYITPNTPKKQSKVEIDRKCNLEVVHEIYDVFKENQENANVSFGEFYMECSDYGKDIRKPWEWLAETFASANCGAPTKPALAMQIWLERKGLKK